MNSRSRIIVWLLLGLLVILLALYLREHLHVQTTRIDLGPSRQAREDPFLAAQYFLRKRGLEVAPMGNPDELNTVPAQGHSLLMPYRQARLSPIQARQLLAWVEAGGHLIMVAGQLWDDQTLRSGDPLLDALGVRLSLTRAPARAKRKAKEKEPPTEASDKNLSKLWLSGSQRPVYLDLSNRLQLSAPHQQVLLKACNDWGCPLLQLAHGQGDITLLTDAKIWSNQRIDQQDHAWLLWYLTQGTTLGLLGPGEPEGLTNLLERYFPEALAVLVLLLGLTLWHLGQRQGPLLPAPAPARRNLREHLQASADFRRRHDGHQALIELLQADIRQRLQRYRPSGQQPDSAIDLVQLLRQFSGLPDEVVSQAMGAPDKRQRPADFIRQVSYLQQLRNAL